jgi:hypothetical protein
LRAVFNDAQDAPIAQRAIAFSSLSKNASRPGIHRAAARQIAFGTLPKAVLLLQFWVMIAR